MIRRRGRRPRGRGRSKRGELKGIRGTHMLTEEAIKEFFDRVQVEPVSVYMAPDQEVLVTLPPGWEHKTVIGQRPAAAPLAAALTFGTLDGLVAYLAANRDQLALSDHVLHVRSPTTVALLGPLRAPTRDRETVAQAVATDCVLDWLGKYWRQAEAVLGLLTRFQDTSARAQLLERIGNIRGETVQTSKDDGVSQIVEQRAGVTLAQTVVLAPIVTLRPYRTFREVDQVEASFCLRVQGGTKPDEGPSVALFEGDGGAWRLAALSLVGEYLSHAVESASIPVPVLV